MQLSGLLASIAALATLTVAVPLTERDAPPAKYYLQSKVQADSPEDLGSNKTDLWLYSYHTGAGLGSANLGANKSLAMEAYYNTTASPAQQLFTYEGNTIGGWPLTVQWGPYQIYEEVQISIASEPDASGYFFNSTGLQWNNTQFVSWLICDGWYGVPQLFAQIRDVEDALPVTCSKVDLMPVAY